MDSDPDLEEEAGLKVKKPKKPVKEENAASKLQK